MIMNMIFYELRLACSKGLYQIQVYLCMHACYPMMQALLGFTCCIIRLYLACLIGSLH